MVTGTGRYLAAEKSSMCIAEVFATMESIHGHLELAAVVGHEWQE